MDASPGLPRSADVDRATLLLEQTRDGKSSAAAELLPLVYDELRRLAEFYLRDERRGHTLQPTALVHEAFLRLVHRDSLGGGDRERFLAIGARAMRRVLIDHARKKASAKRGGGDWKRVTLEQPLGGRSVVDLVALDDVLKRLAERDARAAQVVELRYFGGLSIDETAAILGVSDRTVDNDWFTARGWLARELGWGEGA